MLSAFAAAADSPNPLIPALPDLVWGSIAFAIVLVFFIWRFVPRLNAALDARAKAIEGGLAKAESTQAEAAAALEEYKKQLADARTEAASIREQARLDGTAIIAELKEQATAEANRIAANAKATIEAERQSALVSLRAEVGLLAIDLASSVLGESLSDDKKASAVVDRFLIDLEASEKAKAKN
jgi:F-type H+-transporting ATPase subunit b